MDFSQFTDLLLLCAARNAIFTNFTLREDKKRKPRESNTKKIYHIANDSKSIKKERRAVKFRLPFQGQSAGVSRKNIAEIKFKKAKDPFGSSRRRRWFLAKVLRRLVVDSGGASWLIEFHFSISRRVIGESPENFQFRFSLASKRLSMNFPKVHLLSRGC